MEKLQLARKEINMNQRAGNTDCSPSNPMPLPYTKDMGRWSHVNVHEDMTCNSDYYIRWYCKDCGHTWTTEMPD